MKRFLSVFLVLIVILSFSVSVFAGDQSDPIMLEVDASNYQFVLPEGESIEIGDTICFMPPMINFVDIIDVPSRDISVDVVFAIGIDVFVDDVKISSFVFDLEECYFTFSSKYVGNVDFIITSYFVCYSDGAEDVISSSEERSLMNFYLEGSNNTVLDFYPSVWSSCLIMVTELAKTIVTHPLLLVFVVLSLVGLGIGIFCRVKK